MSGNQPHVIAESMAMLDEIVGAYESTLNDRQRRDFQPVKEACQALAALAMNLTRQLDAATQQ